MKLSLSNEIDIVDGKINIEEIFKNIFPTDELEEALYVCDLTDIVRKYELWREKLPRVQPFYAVKCNDDENVIKLLAALGTGFDCASKAEIKKVLQFDVPSSRIIFANPCKPSSHIRYANTTNTKVMTYDSTIELQKIKQLCPDAKLLLRIRCDAKRAQCPLGEKFGCNPKTEAPMLLLNAKTLGLDVIGISFHVGSGCADPPVFRKAISAARELFDYAETLGFNMNLLDLGGGYPGDKGTNIDEIAKVINAGLADFFPDPHVTIIAEPGRYFVSSAFTLACTVHSKNEILDPNNGTVTHVKYYLNDGVYGSFNCILYDHQIVTPQLLRENNSELQKCSIWGPTCDALDKICDEVDLPNLQIGDTLIFENMGAYTIPVASPFNGFPLPKVLYFIEKSAWDLVAPFYAS